LLLGESGTGKEMVAMAVHRRSARKDGPFVAINCSAIPETLLESELFGHEKGAFTGAHVQRKGRFEMATGGTLFLDEIGELPTALQVKLLRFLQEQCIERVGGRGTIEVDTRIIAATNIDLKQAMKEERFREDLFYRLAVVVIRLPTLREREGDVLFLAKAFLQKFTHENKRVIAGFNRQALQAIVRYDWPGNVREMENRIRRAVIMADGRHISLSDLDLTSAAVASGLQGKGLKEAREQLEREMIERSLARNKGKMSAVSEELGISRPTLYELTEKLGITRS
jgi:two-component system NtrC family response regulator